jgi:Ca2+/H+ antiporter, TMEM165/GDT1 family
MRPNRAGRIVQKIVKVILIALIAATAFGFLVMALWNALIPSIFGLHTITFWQALGLLILAKLLFGGFHRHARGGRGEWRRAMRDRWQNMSPEEREHLRQTMRDRCRRGPFASPVEPQS